MVVLSATLSNLKSEYTRLRALRTNLILPQADSRSKPRKAKRHLTPAEINQLVRRYKKGETMVELGEYYGINRRTVSIHLQKSGIPSRHRTMSPAKVALCIELYQSGHSLVAVGKIVGIDQATVRRALLGAGVSRRK